MFDHIYITGLGTAGYFLVCVPLSLSVAWSIYKYGLRGITSPSLRWVVTLVIAGVMLALPLWDVFAISREAGKLCSEQAGLKVYRTVKADGFLEAGGIGYWAKYGFSYIENGGGDRMSRYTMKDGNVVHQKIQEFISRYESKTGDSHIVIAKHLSRSSDQVVDRQTGEVLGELVVLSIYPGWLDNLFIGLTGTGSGFSPWTCGNKPPAGRKDRLGSNDLVLATIKPANERGAK